MFQALGFLADSSETLIYYLFFDLYLLTFCFKVGSVMSCISLTIINNWHQKGLLLILKKVLTVEELIYTSICMWQSKLTILCMVYVISRSLFIVDTVYVENPRLDNPYYVCGIKEFRLVGPSAYCTTTSTVMPVNSFTVGQI